MGQPLIDARGDSVLATVVVASTGASAWLLETLALLMKEPTGAGVIVVLNGAGSGRRMGELPPDVEVEYLPRANLSAARNFGLQRAKTELVAFLDDDAAPMGDWCGALARALIAHPEAAAAGGPALPGPESPLPCWIGPETAGYLGLVDLGDEEMQCPPWRYPYGCNFAVRRALALDAGGFREDLGYRAGRFVPGEETEFFRRVQDQGRQVLWVPAASVVHHVAPERLRLGYLVRRAFWQGFADQRIRTLHPDFPTPTLGRGLYSALRWTGAALYRSARRDQVEAVAHLLRVVRTGGALRFALSRQRSANGPSGCQ